MWLFRLARTWIYVGNLIGGAFAAATAALYAFILAEPMVRFNATQLGASVLDHFLPAMVLCSAIAIGHGVLFVQTACNPLARHWRLNRVRTAQADQRTKSGPQPAAVLPSPPSRPRPRTVPNDKYKCWPRVRGFCISWSMEVRTGWRRHHAEITRLFMIWEVANQTYQAHKMSNLVASVWINRIVSLVIVANCWFSPVIHYVMRARRLEQIRLARLLIDLCLDLVYGIGIPIVIFYPYYRDYINAFDVFPLSFYYTDTWYVNTISELRQIFVTSWVDLVSKTTGGVALLYRLYVVEHVLKDVERPQVVSDHVSNAMEQRRRCETSLRRLALELRSRLTKILDFVLLVWGLIVLVLHVYSAIVAFRGDRVGCLLETRPWGSSTYSCMVLEVSCKARGLTGTDTDMVDALDNVDPQNLRVLIVSHCTQLHMRPVLQDFAALSMLKVYNSTIVTWDETAAFRDATHPELQVMYFTRVNMTELPAGLLAPDFPSQVWDMEFCITDLATLPPAVAQAWQHVAYLVFDLCPLMAEIPAAILTLPSLLFVFIEGASIRAVPDAVFAERALIYLSLDANRLDHLPPTINLLGMQTVSIQNTNISSLPASWLAVEPQMATGRITIQAHGTPLCASVGDQPTAMGPFNITCTLRPLNTFPLDDEDHWRATNA